MTRTPHMRGDFPYRSVDDIQHANERSGSHYFDRSTMQFFRSRVLDGVYGGRYFITSERPFGDSPRTYTVREARPSGHVETVGEFQGYTTAHAARKAAQSIRDGHSVYFAELVLWANEHADGDWRRAADYAGMSLNPKHSSAVAAGIRADRAELRRMFARYAAEVR